MQSELTSKIIAFAIINDIEPVDAVVLPAVFEGAARKIRATGKASISVIELAEIALRDTAIAEYLKKVALNVAQSDKNNYKAATTKG